MNIYENGEFVCTAFEKNDTTKDNGKWKRIGDNLFFEDATGTGNFSAFMPSRDKIVLENQPFSEFGTQLLYIKVGDIPTMHEQNVVKNQ